MILKGNEVEPQATSMFNLEKKYSTLKYTSYLEITRSWQNKNPQDERNILFKY